MRDATKKRWIKALRSGEYKQGKQYLHRPDNTFCCLGVLLDTEVEGDWLPPSGHEQGYHLCYSDGITDEGTLGDKLSQVLGLSEHEEIDLIGANDYDDLSFEDIAVGIDAAKRCRD